MDDQELAVVINAFYQSVNGLRAEVRRNSAYLAREEIRGILTALEEGRLERSGFKVYSQNDEDGIVAEIFRRLGINSGVFCEIGVENGLECNSLFLLHQGWCGAWVEGNEGQREAILNKFSGLVEKGKLSLTFDYVTAENVNHVVDNAFKKMFEDVPDIDFLSIDIDGMDIYLFKALDVRPKVVCIEYNAKFPPEMVKTPVYNAENVWQGGDYMGSSLAAINQVANEKGYCLVGTNITGANAFFVREDLMGTSFSYSRNLASLYNPPRYWLHSDYFSQGIGHYPDFGPYSDLV